MAWQDRLSSWIDGQIERVPALDGWFERHFHAIGLHGPEVRHLAKTRFVPLAAIATGLLLVLLVTWLVRRSGRSSGPSPSSERV